MSPTAWFGNTDVVALLVAGGWVAVLIVVRWFMQRMDRMIDGFTAAVESFRRFEHEEEVTHERILELLKDISNRLEELRAAIANGKQGRG